MQNRRNAIVTGAASGLGRAIAVELARGGWHVALCDLNELGSRETLTLVEQAGGAGQVEHLDVTQSDQWSALGEKLRGAWPQLDLLVNNAGVAVAGDVGQLPLDDWRWIININLYGAIYGCHVMVPWMKTNSRGAHIVNIASAAAVASAPGMAPYNITKAGMVSLSETLYGELKSHGIGVTAVCPAFFPTNIITSGRFQSADERSTAERLMSQSRATAEVVAKRVVRAVERKELYVLVPTVARVFWWMKRLMPRTFLKMIAQRRARESAARASSLN
jgi:NAD(P)-dependent dehydrogenase (short-subunit alcohol dehydrogenase family)